MSAPVIMAPSRFNSHKSHHELDTMKLPPANKRVRHPKVIKLHVQVEDLDGFVIHVGAGKQNVKWLSLVISQREYQMIWSAV